MSLVLGERVLETSTTTGTSAFTLNGPTVGFQSFFDKVGNGNTCYYTIRNRTVPAEWETGIGTISGTSASGILTRTTILSSSTGSAVSFSAGTKDIFDTLPASKSVYTDTSNKLLIDTTTSLEVETTNLPISMPSLNLDFARSKQLDPRITFGRLSAATYYDGKTTAKAEENLLTYSQDFSDVIWTKAAVTVTANSIAAPDGTITANLILETATTAQHYLGRPSTVITPGSTFSIFFKKYTNTRNFQLFTGNQNYGVAVDVSVTPPVATNINSTNVAQNITVVDVGNSWYRLSFTAASNIGTVGALIFWTSQNVGFYLGDTSFGIYAWGAQLEQRSSVTAYTPTTTTAITNYIPVLVSAPSNVPRFDHDSRPTFNATATVSGSIVTLPTTFADGSSPSSVNNYYKGSITVANVSYPIVSYKGSTRVLTVTGSPTSGSQAIVLTNKNYGQSLGLLIEEARENKSTYSSDFSNAPWLKNGGGNLITINSNTIVAPDGTLTGTKILESIYVQNHVLYRNFEAITTSSPYTFTIYAKAAERQWLYIQTQGTFTYHALFNLSNGTVGTACLGATSYNITPVGNGWYKCSVTATSSTTTASNLYFEPQISDARGTHQGNGYSGIYIWGAQFEAGTFATSYVPTPSNATVTRQPDVVGIPKSSWFNSSEGTFYLEAQVGKLSTTGAFGSTCCLLTNNIAADRLLIYVQNSTTNISAEMYNGSSNPIVVKNIGSLNQKVAVSYGSSSLTVAGNGLSPLSASGTLVFFNTTTQFNIGANPYSSGNYLNGYFKKLTYYPQALSSLELQGLTK